MRGDIVAALLHSPEILFLDEPTIGLDVVAKEKIREFIKYINEKEQTTIIFTTHDMQDIEKVCDRLIIIDKGKKIYDGSIEQIRNKYTNSKTIEILLENDEKVISICEPEIDSIIRDIYEGRVILENPAMGEN